MISAMIVFNDTLLTVILFGFGQERPTRNLVAFAQRVEAHM